MPLLIEAEPITKMAVEGASLWPRLKAGHVFPGLAPFIDRASANRGLTPLMAGHARSGSWHARAAQSALGELPNVAARVVAGTAPETSMVGMLDRIREVRQSLAAELDGLDAAILDTFTALEIPLPSYLHKTKSK